MSKLNQVIDNIFQNATECSFSNDKKDVCSPDPVVNKMSEFIKLKKGVHFKEPDKIVHNMKELMNCKSESCIIRHPDFINFAKLSNVDSLLDEFFKPNGPAKNFNLLSNFNIDDVLDQLQERFPDFLHIPFQMRDFEKVGSELATIDLAEKFKNGTRSFGVVLNTDWSDGRGIHWYCIFGEKLSDRIVLEYFNSSGKDPLPETQTWLQKQKHYIAKTLNIPVEVKYSTGIKFQNDEHSCGVYCLMYLWLRLEGVPNKWFTADSFNDKIMHDARSILFRHEK